jgi:hypothetical protein
MQAGKEEILDAVWNGSGLLVTGDHIAGIDDSTLLANSLRDILITKP